MEKLVSAGEVVDSSGFAAVSWEISNPDWSKPICIWPKTSSSWVSSAVFSVRLKLTVFEGGTSPSKIFPGMPEHRESIHVWASDFLEERKQT